MSADALIIALKASELPAPHTAPRCRKCQCEDGYLARYIQTNGKTAVRWVCDWCEDYGTASDLPHACVASLAALSDALHPHGLFEGRRVVDINDLPLRIDKSDDPTRWPRCVVCENQAVETHHWAPRSIFADWPFDLAVPMCKLHHDEWHTRLREHGLRWPHEIAK